MVQNKDGEGEGHRRHDERMRWESLVKRERELCQSGVAEQVWARCQSGHSAHEEAVLWPALTATTEGGAFVPSTFACRGVGF